MVHLQNRISYQIFNSGDNNILNENEGTDICNEEDEEPKGNEESDTAYETEKEEPRKVKTPMQLMKLEINGKKKDL